MNKYVTLSCTVTLAIGLSLTKHHTDCLYVVRQAELIY